MSLFRTCGIASASVMVHICICYVLAMEIIYKNLVDLSIDENQLPSRLTRSKDPEPRQKDVVPILSDFFTPISIDEYCTPVSVKPRSPETIDYWNAFRISDQIYEWKHTLNHI